MQSCKKNTPKEDCIEEFIAIHDLERYSDQVIDEETYFELYETDQEFFFLARKHILTIIPDPFDCAGEKICENPQDSSCYAFMAGAIDHGIVAITK